MNQDFRTGLGIDVHEFQPDKKLILGGVQIPNEKGLKGHSDADVIVHSICDAIFGALCLGDIGIHFPDTDPKNKDADSMIFLLKAAELLIQEQYSINNLDVMLTLQKPKIQPYLTEMRENISKVLNIELNQISIKATTTEKLGFVGREEGVVSFATVLIKKNPPL
ncbi:MAG TPA: 2-C-methyl-D-erythritol 2,4-cyclodiphosphate synthase [Ignavibacteriaceae bacterium]|nr:2-C-methyl-D-erythritol 2,4-cyclodiphosphate synthase [Ignavibacteriaceae bacterium]